MWHSENKCTYCNGDLTSLKSEHYKNFHYKTLLCTKCAKKIFFKVNFHGSGHDNLKMSELEKRMVIWFKICQKRNYLSTGMAACAGCGAAIAMRNILKAAGKNTIISHATGCMEVVSSAYPLLHGKSRGFILLWKCSSNSLRHRSSLKALKKNDVML